MALSFGDSEVLIDAIVRAVVAVFNLQNRLSVIILVLCVVMLNILSIISLFTGFRVKFWTYKLRPVIFTGCSLLIIMALL